MTVGVYGFISRVGMRQTHGFRVNWAVRPGPRVRYNAAKLLVAPYVRRRRRGPVRPEVLAPVVESSVRQTHRFGDPRAAL
jgi:hypothetical protein